jgi:hypothetical protein
MPGDPHSGSKVWKAADREIGKPGLESWKSNRAPSWIEKELCSSVVFRAVTAEGTNFAGTLDNA